MCEKKSQQSSDVHAYLIYIYMHVYHVDFVTFETLPKISASLTLNLSLPRQERCRCPDDWRTAVLALTAAQQTAEPDGGQQSALAALLDHLASTLAPDQLRQVLAERAAQHGACLLRCHNVQRADVVRAQIMKMA